MNRTSVAEAMEQRLLLAAQLVRDINPGGRDAAPENLVDVNGTLYFTADNGRHGVELWTSDGTTAGTGRVADVFPGRGGSSPQRLTNVGGTVYFTADDGVHGRELWKSDGTAAGTALVKDLTPGPADSFGDPDGELTSYEMLGIGQTLYFTLDGDLWRSDGTAEGTVLVKDTIGLSGQPIEGLNGWTRGRIHELMEMGGTLFFAYHEFMDFFSEGVGAQFASLWKSDGTIAGTARLKLIGDSGPLVADAGDDWIFFIGHEVPRGRESWASDGTARGTVSLQTFINTFAGGSVLAIDNVGYFMLDDSNIGAPPEEPQTERILYKFRGTIRDTPVSGFRTREDPQLVGVGGTPYFKASTGSAADAGIWTPGGIAVPDVPDADELTAISDALYFRSGGKLWRFATPVADLDPNSSQDAPSNLTPVGSTLFFTSDHETHGRELWSIGTSFASLSPDGVLHVEGRDPSNLNDPIEINGNDNIGLFVRGDTLHVWRALRPGAPLDPPDAGTTLKFPLAGIKRIEIDGRSGSDVIDWSGVDIPTYCFGGVGNDRITGGGAADTLSGGAGRDYLDGGGGDDFVSGGATNDELFGGPGNDHLTGGDANDILSGGPHADRIYGDGGNDVLTGNAGNDTMYAGDGDDQLTGGTGWDLHSGQAGNDRLFARDGRDDELLGGDGDDAAEHDPLLDVLLAIETSSG